jgi:hypothetical protein
MLSSFLSSLYPFGGVKGISFIFWMSSVAREMPTPLVNFGIGESLRGVGFRVREG